MKFLWFALLLAAISVTNAPAAQQKSGNGLPADARELKIGDSAPDFSLKGIDGRTYTLADFKKGRVLMVVFLSNHCPVSHAVETRLIPYVTKMKEQGLEVVAINPNHPDAVRVDELGYSKYNDSFEEMKLYAKEKGFVFPYLYDGDTQTTAKAYGCLATPHVFIFDQDRKLRYMGRYDDSRFVGAGTVQKSDAPRAITALLAGENVPVEVTKPQGCSTKWLSKKSDNLQVDDQWNQLPVTVEKIDANGAAALARNDTKRLRLINVWATWCAPCVKEFPALTSLSRRLGTREFELVTISVDEPKDEAKVVDFLKQKGAVASPKLQGALEKEGRKTNNYLYTGANTEDLMKALDKDAPGPVPFTLLVGPGGKVLFRQSGEVDSAELLAKVLAHLGPYYTP